MPSYYKVLFCVKYGKMQVYAGADADKIQLGEAEFERGQDTGAFDLYGECIIGQGSGIL